MIHAKGKNWLTDLVCACLKWQVKRGNTGSGNIQGYVHTDQKRKVPKVPWENFLAPSDAKFQRNCWLLLRVHVNLAPKNNWALNDWEKNWISHNGHCILSRTNFVNDLITWSHRRHDNRFLSVWMDPKMDTAVGTFYIDQIMTWGVSD